MAVIHPTYTTQTGWRGVQVTAEMDENTIGMGCRVFFGQGKFELRVHFCHSTPYGGNPLHIYHSNRVEGGCKLPPKIG